MRDRAAGGPSQPGMPNRRRRAGESQLLRLKSREDAGEIQAVAWKRVTGTRLIFSFFNLLNAYLAASWALQTTGGLVRELEHESRAAQARTGLGRREITFFFFFSF